MTAVGAAGPAIGVVMAGGSGERMLRSGLSVPKPMVPVLGSPLLERNLGALLRAGVIDLRVVVAAAGRTAEAVRRWQRERGQHLAAAAGARLQVVTEEQPWGNFGFVVPLLVAERLPGLVVYADNLTSLDLAGLLARHHRSGADLTLAVHEQRIQLPYGQVQLEPDGELLRVLGYREKPLLPVTVGSGVCVVGPGLVSALAAGPSRPRGVVDAVNEAVGLGLSVLAHPHAAPWVDVNDRSGRAEAEALLRRHPTGFERWWPDRLATVRVPTSAAGDVVADVDDPADPDRPAGPDGPHYPDDPDGQVGPAELDDLDDAGRPVRVRIGPPPWPDGLSQVALDRLAAWAGQPGPSR
jgi:NDP-mannose synthase